MRRAILPTIEHLVGAALVLLAVTPWLAITSPVDAGIVVLGAAAVATIISLVAVRGAKATVSTELTASLLALVVFLLVAVLRDPFAFGEAARGLRDGLPRILSTTLPILDVRWAFVPAAAVAWGAGAVATSAIARGRSVALPIAVSLFAFGSGYAATLGGTSGDPAAVGAWTAPALAALGCALAALRADRVVLADQRQRALGRAAAATGVVVVGVAVAVFATAHAPYVAEEPYQPRLVPDAAALEPVSPLLVTRRLRADGAEQTAAEVTVSDPWAGYVPLAALQDYDGRIWSLERDRFDATGGVLPADLPVPGGGVAAFERVDLRATGGWLPYVARPAAVEGASVLHNGGGALQLAEPAATVDYRLRLSQPSFSLRDEDLRDDAVVATGSAVPIAVPTSMSDRRPAGERLCRFLSFSRDGTADPEIDGVPCGSRAPREVGFLRELSATLRDGRAVQEDLIGGDQLEAGSEALYDLLELVGAARGPDAVGTPEQFATAYALMADDFGIPVRVVTGFRVEEPPVDRPIELTGAEAWTWVEVPIEDHGWVVIDPSPSDEDALEDEELDEVSDSDDTPEPVEEERTLVGVDPSQPVGAPPPPVEQPNRWPLLLLLIPLAPLALAAMTLLRRALRRRRRRRGDDRERVVGAWHETLDRVYDAGIRDVSALSARQITDAVVLTAPWLGDDLDRLAAAANRAIFSSRPVTVAEVDAVWATTRRVRRDLRKLTPWRERLRALTSPPPKRLTSREPTGDETRTPQPHFPVRSGN